MNKQPLIVSWGGGKNSTALIVGLWQRGIIPDLILFADTGGEKPETYQFIKTFSAWLGTHGMPQLITVSSASPTRTLENDCLQRGTLPSIAFGFKTCSQRWKVEPMDKFLNSWQPALDAWRLGSKCVQAIGIHADEAHRVPALKAVIPNDSQESLFAEIIPLQPKQQSEKAARTARKYEFWYPLIDWDWGQEECENAIRESDLPMPPKSACFFCPSNKKHEILELRDSHPELLERALQMEDKARPNLGTVAGLGRNYAWRDFVERVDAEHAFLQDDTVSAPCLCWDGGD
jgi:3'-phosphoadenosine 5'-phosphosulfate sulfotransferase (PAPS reductase)/FAD synthetase